MSRQKPSPRQTLAPLPMPTESPPSARKASSSFATIEEAPGPSEGSFLTEPAPSTENAWQHAHGLLNDVRDRAREVVRAEAKERAREEFREAKAAANDLWRSQRFDECLAQLDTTLSLRRESDVLHRYRSRCHSRQGGHRGAVACG